MGKLMLNGSWKMRWSDGTRGGMPHFIVEDISHLGADLQGRKKKLGDYFDEAKWMDCTVPGEVHLELIKNGLIEDPYVGDNILKARWVEEYIWSFRYVFDACNFYNREKCMLVFEGLDYGAVVYLNGDEVARHSNAYYPLEIDISGILKEKDNELIVMLESGLYSVAEKKVSNLYTAVSSIDLLLHKRLWLRKPQSSTGWDWSQRLLNIGIFKDVYIKYSEIAVVKQITLSSQTTSDLSEALLNIRVFIDAKDGLDNQFTLEVDVDGQMYSFQKPVMVDGVINTSIIIQKPRLWYPIGYGKQELYTVGVKLLYKNNSIYEDSKKTGFRHVEIDQSPHPGKGRYFNLLINGIRVFAKGANFVPVDMILFSADTERYTALIERAVECNFNMLRVWGGGVYESDTFYSLCNEHGIMVWQDFISACGVIPFDDKEIAHSIKNEIVYNVRRLSVNPSLIVWCGNNELDTDVLYKKAGIVAKDFELYNYVMPLILKQEDPEKYYQPSSPYSLDFEDYNSDYTGDQHPWGIGFADKDHRKYRQMECRFPNEGGVMGPVSYPTLLDCLAKGQNYMHSFSWQLHDNYLEGLMPETTADYSVSFFTGINPRDLTLENYVYLGGFLQGEGLTEYIDNFRRRKFDSGAAVFWMFNDCWPCTRSWTVVDYRLNRTPAFYHVKRAFASVRGVVVEENGEFEIYCINDTMLDFNGLIRFGAFTCDGRYIIDLERDISMNKNCSQRFTKFSVEETEKIKSLKAIPFILLYDTNRVLISKNRYIYMLYKEMNLEKSEIKVSFSEDYGRVVFSSNVFVPGVCIDLDGDNMLHDNMFDLFPGIPYEFECMNADAIEVKYCLNDILAE